MKINDRLKEILSLALRFGLSGLLLAYLFSKIDTHSMMATLKTADFKYIYLAAGMFLLIHVVLLLRWLLFIRALSLEIPVKTLVAYFFIGLFFNLFLPSSTGGDLVKVLGLCRYTDQKAKVVASVVLDRVCGFVAIVIVAFCSYGFGYGLLHDHTILIGIFVLALMCVILLTIFFNEKFFSFGSHLFARFPKIKDSLMSLHYNISLVKGRIPFVFLAFLLSCLSQSLLIIDFFFVSMALHQSISLIYFFIFVPIICVVSSLPSIGGLGVRDAGAAHLFAKIGVAEGVSVSLTLVNFIFMVIIGLIGGIVYVAHLSPRRVQHHQACSTSG